ncbi:MAG: recombination protein O N-terminal domain-containing protein [Treponema sp.]|jgi:DNA repair protein RecO (recombination protein O)|nr:recombination protein O N-terminal domain-containing protein [Treponema sp.]
MTRNVTYSALVLRVRPAGESNREAFFLTAESGIIKATVFGGPKSKLRSYVSPFHQGTLWVYHDTVKDFMKTTDFDVTQWRPGLRELYERSMAAAAVADTITATHAGGGQWAAALDHAGRTLDALDSADAPMALRVFYHFLWNWIDLIGEKPSLRGCSLCGSPFDGAVLYAPVEGAFLCPSCGEGHHGLPLGTGARKWLAAVENLPPAALNRWLLDTGSLAQARSVIMTLMAGLLGRKLESWNW